jgi:excisionase family DNA binding protein
VPSRKVASVAAIQKATPELEPILHTREEIARVIRVSTRTVDTLQATRRIPYVKVGRLVRFKLHDVLRALDKMTIREVS